MKMIDVTAEQAYQLGAARGEATEDIFEQMRKSLEDDPNTHFVVLVSNDSGICAYDNGDYILDLYGKSAPEIGADHRSVKNTVKYWYEMWFKGEIK